MPRARIAAGLLSLLLAALLVWTVVRGVGDLGLRVLLGFGIVLGLAYAAVGRLPEWLIVLSQGSVTNDDDPANISPRVFLPILGAAILIAAVALGIGLWLL